ncbi:unannotated protein [freshwater metagenome]|uniref:Unannotated protein n=2 Tax=freshwater metagenome TaxID=449393 RepID=A0A6J6V7N2_9ZZZZ|nr:Stk1 family PASTA domain-containing Ser/Thr kinase [Actinomycetota bacterium]MSW57240.1 Stk1 family PASTA domain-containing Ser/Thr kinase [Actinomycetota bacterium]MSX48885.1 Stk1 family PASTA domain-containing Ser/Thr kinase [Actinomycetota bacterium]MSY09383.1 Stk1 family PASTA domain-containing Ser/Thr kinase [Actinomycetota bacterium]MTA67535.1 Stk1 family PASTA domain-containing Ser/Thr kinase [Actinomycetota bacterium]
MNDLSGELIDGRYELLRQVASGGMATIYEALDTRLDRKVAVKIMHAHLANDEEFVGRFIKEAKAAAALSHPNIVAVQDQGWNQNGVPAVFLVMELIDGHTLRDYLFERGALSPAESIQFLIPILSALAAAHKIGIVHRDIKPENVLISSTGRIKIADFGLARGELLGSTMTAESSVILGSVSYLSPEQVQRGIADARSDLYSVGIVAFEMLTGAKPFEGDSPIQIAYMHVNERVPLASSKKSGIPASLDALIYKATSSNPDERPAHAGEFLESLRLIQSELDPKKTQMSLELDLPPAPIRDKSRKAPRVSPVKTSPSSDTVETMALEKELKPAGEKTSEIRRRRASSRVRRNRWIALILVIALGTGAWYVLVGPGTRIVVPSVAGMSVKEAKATLKPLGLTSEISEKVFSEEIPSGKIISSKPGGGGRVSAGGKVLFQVSQGPERYKIADIKGFTLEAATALLTKDPVSIGTISEVFSNKIEQGLVVASDPVAGTSVKRDTSIDITISKGQEQVALTSYVGLSGEQALNELTTEGFDVSSVYAFSDTVPIGAVISQSPDGGATAAKGAKIDLVVSQGSESVFVPNVYSLTQAKATGVLQDFDLKVIVKKIGKKSIKTVTNVSPTVGTKVKRGSTVVITVG